MKNLYYVTGIATKADKTRDVCCESIFYVGGF